MLVLCLCELEVMPTFKKDGTFLSLFPLLYICFYVYLHALLCLALHSKQEKCCTILQEIWFFSWGGYVRIHFTELHIPTCMFTNPVSQFYHWESLSFILKTGRKSSGRGWSYYSGLNHSIYPPVTFTIMVVLFLLLFIYFCMVSLFSSCCLPCANIQALGHSHSDQLRGLRCQQWRTCNIDNPINKM